MPIQAPQWTEFLSCPVCCNEFDVAVRGPISLGCGHTICRTCLANLHRKQCPFDQSPINIEIEKLPVNEALLQLVGENVPTNSANPTNLQSLVYPQDFANYLLAKGCIEELALYLKPQQPGTNNGISLVSRPMQRKLVTLVGCQLIEPEGRSRAVRAARSLGERSVTELILQHQNPQQLSANLWAAVRARGCQFLGPAMQEEVLKLVLLALEDGSALSRKVLVMFVVQRLEMHFPQASKTSIGHVVQLLYRASCFKVSKREGDSSLMQLKEEFRAYEALRREHDAQIVQIATEAGLRIAPDQWSALLYGDTAHKSHMQSIIDKLQTPQSFAQSIQELLIALQRTSDPGQLSNLRPSLELLASIDPSPDSDPPQWSQLCSALQAIKIVVTALVDFIQQHGNRKSQDSIHTSTQSKYKVSMCRDLSLRGSCPRSKNCTFAHSDLELDKYRSKNRRIINRSTLVSDTNNQGKADKKELKQSYQNFSKTSFNQANKPNNPEQNSYFGSCNYILPNRQNFERIVQQDVLGSPYILPTNPFDCLSANLQVWDATQNGFSNNAKKQRKTLAMLLQRKMDIISQLENFVSKQSPNQVHYQNQNEPVRENFSIWSDASILEPYPPTNLNFTNIDNKQISAFEDNAANQFGPITRSKSIIRPEIFNDSLQSSITNQTSGVQNSRFCNPLYTNLYANGGNQQLPGTSFNDSCINLNRNFADTISQMQFNRQDSVSKDIILESQKVKQELKHLEKKINELKIATQGVPINEGERLNEELKLIEAGIKEKERDVSNWSPYSNVPWVQPTFNLFSKYDTHTDFKINEDDIYDADIANDMREFELKWESELQEHEKRWSHEQISN